MHKIVPWALALAATCFALPVAAQAPARAVASLVGMPSAARGEVVPDVAPGDEIVVACAPIQERDANADVRVVLTISAIPSETPPGYKKVLATEEQLNKYAVRVRVPNVPNLPDHTVNLDVYVVGQNTSACDGGHLKVVARRTPDFRHETKTSPVS